MAFEQAHIQKAHTKAKGLLEILKEHAPHCFDKEGELSFCALKDELQSATSTTSATSGGG